MGSPPPFLISNVCVSGNLTSMPGAPAYHNRASREEIGHARGSIGAIGDLLCGRNAISITTENGVCYL